MTQAYSKVMFAMVAVLMVYILFSFTVHGNGFVARQKKTGTLKISESEDHTPISSTLFLSMDELYDEVMEVSTDVYAAARSPPTTTTTQTTTTVPTTHTTTTVPTTHTTTTVPTTHTTTTVPTTQTTTTVPTTQTTTTVPKTQTTTIFPTTQRTTKVPTTQTKTRRKTPANTSRSKPFVTSCGKFHLITTYFVGVPTELNTPKFKNVAKYFGQQYRNYTDTQLADRNKEYVDTLQHNLNHPCVKKIHLFYAKEEDLKLLRDYHLNNFQKVDPVKHNRTLHMLDFFLFASSRLIGKPVVALNGDIELEEGFEKIDVQKMLDQKLLYSLSRYERKTGCKSEYGVDMCTPQYRGSHDCHIFALAEPLNKTLLFKHLDVPINMYQSENGMIYTMRTIFNFTVTNPCYDVKVYHHHCSKVHGPHDKKYSIKSIGWNGRQVAAGFAHPVTL